MRPRAAWWTKRGWTATIGASAVLAALAVAPGHAVGSVHFGDNLIGNPDSDTFCGQHCTLWNTNIYLSNTAGTVTSPINGVLVTWTIKKQAESPGTTTHPVHARVLEMVGSQWRGLGAAADVIPPTAGGIHSYPTRLPIAQGNSIAIEFDNDSAAPPLFASNIFGASMKLRSPPFPTAGPPETISGNFSGWQDLSAWHGRAGCRWRRLRRRDPGQVPRHQRRECGLRTQEEMQAQEAQGQEEVSGRQEEALQAQGQEAEVAGTPPRVQTRLARPPGYLCPDALLEAGRRDTGAGSPPGGGHRQRHQRLDVLGGAQRDARAG